MIFNRVCATTEMTRIGWRLSEEALQDLADTMAGKPISFEFDAIEVGTVLSGKVKNKVLVARVNIENKYLYRLFSDEYYLCPSFTSYGYYKKSKRVIHTCKAGIFGLSTRPAHVMVESLSDFVHE